MAFIPRLSVIAGKIESTSGTEETLVGADAAIVVSDPQVDDDVELIERNFLSSSLSKFAPLIGVKSRRIQFGTELKGSGAAGTPPETDAFLRACGMSVTNAPSTSDIYTPNNGAETITIGRWVKDGTSGSVMKKIKGGMGAFSLEGRIGDAMRVSFDFLGQYLDVADASSPSGVTPDTLKPPQLLSIAFTVGGFSPKISTITINGGQVVTLPSDIGANGVEGKSIAILSERNLEVTFDPEMTTVAAHDWYGNLKAGAEAAMQLVVGSTAGNQFTIDIPKLQYVGITEAERDGAAINNVTCRANRDAGDDEISITFD